MVRSIIRYVVLTAVVIGIVLLMGSLIKDDTKSISNKKDNNKVDYYTVSIKVLDEETRKFINGGKFIMKNSQDEIVAEWNNLENVKRIDKLKNGTYTIEQVSAIDGYEKSEDETFKVYNSDKDVIIYNKAIKEEVVTSSEVGVDNTLSVRGIFSYIISIITICLGLGLVINKKIRV